MASVGGVAPQPSDWQWSNQYGRWFRYELRNNQYYQIWHDPNQGGPSDPRQLPNYNQQLQSGYGQGNYAHTAGSAAVTTGYNQPYGLHGNTQAQGQNRSSTEAQPSDLLHANTDRGLRETLDPDYRERQDADTFFCPGRMFSILFTEPYNDRTARARGNPSNITCVRFNELVYSQIRRFIVVENRRGFCYALPISTYSGRATTKPGLEPRDHSVVYSSGRPQLLPGEVNIVKAPIKVNLSSSNISLDPRSRLDFGIQIPIQHNVKVKELGMVAEEDHYNLYTYWQIAQRSRQ